MAKKKILIVLTSTSHVECLSLVNIVPESEAIIATLLPGITITEDKRREIYKKFGDSAEILLYENTIKSFSQLQISEQETKYTKFVLDVLGLHMGKGKAEDRTALGILKSQANMIALAIHPMATFAMLFEKVLLDYAPSLVVLFGHEKLTFKLPERPDVKTLYYSDLAFYPIAVDICRTCSITYTVCRVYRTAAQLHILNAIRRALLQTYKLAVIAKRIFRKKKSDGLALLSHKRVVLIVIRAESEYWSVQPVYEQIGSSSDFHPVIIQDDLIKSPSARRVLDKQKIVYTDIHSKTFLHQLLLSFFRAWSVRRRILSSYEGGSQISFQEPSLLDSVFLNEGYVKEILKSVTSSLPELLLFDHEMRRHISDYDPVAIITMDMVDQWGGILGNTGRDCNVKTFTLQNTALDKIIYPMPVSTDYFWVAGNAVSEMLALSNGDASRIIVTGLPMYDAILKSASLDEKEARIGIRNQLSIPASDQVILIATQPFVQDYPYNYELINELVTAFKDQPGVCLLVKTHPRETIEHYRPQVAQWAKDAQCSILVNSGTNILDIMKVASVMVSRTSTAIMSSVLLGLPTISYLHGYPIDIVDRLDYLKTAATIKIHTPDKLREICRFLLQKNTDYDAFYGNLMDERKSYIQECVGAPDGSAARRIVEHLRETVGAPLSSR